MQDIQNGASMRWKPEHRKLASIIDLIGQEEELILFDK